MSQDGSSAPDGSLVVLPPFDALEALDRVRSRLLWQWSLFPRRFSRIVLFLAPPLAREQARARLGAPVPPEFDPLLSMFAAQFAARFALEDGSEPQIAAALAGAGRAVFLWDQAGAGHLVETMEGLAGRIAHLHVTVGDTRVEKDAERRLGTLFREAATGGDAAGMAVHHARLLQRMDDLRDRSRHIALFAPGPSMAALKDRALPGGVSVVCNGLLANRRLLDRIQPDFVALIDPMLHAGPIAYAAHLRAALRTALLERPGLWLLTRHAHVATYARLLPDEVHGRIIGIPALADVPVNLDLATAFHTRRMGNVLTTLLLPFAASFAAEVALAGFDGRAPASAERLWDYDPDSRIADPADSYRRIFPAASAADDAAYAAEHAANVGRMVEAMEAKGCRVTVLTPSHIPALVRRQAPPPSGTGGGHI